MHTKPKNWERLKKWFEEKFGMEADEDAMLFLIGVQELGKGFEEFDKTKKLELIHIGICTILSGNRENEGYYRFTHRDSEGWPHYEAIKKLPPLKGRQQNIFIRARLIEYFDEYLTD